MGELSAFECVLERARQGDETAMTELVTRYEPEVRMVARIRLGAALRPYLDSLDLVQSVHRSLMMGLRNDRFDISSPDKLVALATTIVRRKVARQWRHLRRQQRLEGIPASSESMPDILAALQATDSDPAHVAALSDQMRRVWELLDPLERQLIELRIDGLSTAEVARELGLDADVLRVRLSRLRQRLRGHGLLTDWV